MSSGGASAASPCTAAAPSWSDWLCALAGVLVLSDVFDVPFYVAFGHDARVLPGLPPSRVLLLLVVLAAASLLVRDLTGAAALLRRAWLLWPAIAWAFISTLWSDQPATTVLWATALCATSAFGLGVALRLSARAQVDLVAAATMAMAAASAALALLGPAAPSNGWRGLFMQRNLLARVCALGVVTAAVGVLSSQRRLHVVALVICFATMLAAHSRTSLIAAVVTLITLALLYAARRWSRHTAVILIGGATTTALAIVLLVTTPEGLSLLGRQPTLTGRTILWRTIIEATADRPWLGRGFAAFWPGPRGQQTQQSLEMPPVAHGHNGFLDVYAELGLIGLALVGLPFAWYAVGAVRHALQSGAPACIWPAAYMAFLTVTNVTESPLMRHKIWWALYVAVACHVGWRGRVHERKPPRHQDTNGSVLSW